LGFGGGVLGLGVGGFGPTPQSPIPNPQSPIPIYRILKSMNKNNFNFLKISYNIIKKFSDKIND
jgi:hypothetical protein